MSRRKAEKPGRPETAHAPQRGAVQRAASAATIGAGVTGSYLSYLAQAMFLSPTARKTKLATHHQTTARRVADGMLELRGPLMKLGQTLSMYSEMLPDETIRELSRLQMSAPGMHPSLTRTQFRASMGRDPEDMFAEFDVTPFAAASLGQVHRATLRSGETVAVKIQYPGILDAIEGDFKWFRAIAAPARISKYIPTEILNEFQTQIRAEADYAREAGNIELFAKQLAPLAFVQVPHVYRDYSNDRILTMSLVPGEHVEKFLATGPSQELRDLVGTRLFELFYFQLLQMHAFHADPHWGNYLFRSDGTIGLIDFGCVKYLPATFVDELRKTFFYNGRYDTDEFKRLIEGYYASAGRPPSRATIRAHAGIYERFYGKVYRAGRDADAKPFDFSDADVIREYFQETTKLIQAKALHPQYLFLGRAEMGLYNILHRFGARVRTGRILQQYL